MFVTCPCRHQNPVCVLLRRRNHRLDIRGIRTRNRQKRPGLTEKKKKKDSSQTAFHGGNPVQQHQLCAPRTGRTEKTPRKQYIRYAHHTMFFCIHTHLSTRLVDKNARGGIGEPPDLLQMYETLGSPRTSILALPKSHSFSTCVCCCRSELEKSIRAQTRITRRDRIMDRPDTSGWGKAGQGETMWRRGESRRT